MWLGAGLREVCAGDQGSESARVSRRGRKGRRTALALGAVAVGARGLGIGQNISRAGDYNGKLVPGWGGAGMGAVAAREGSPGSILAVAMQRRAPTSPESPYFTRRQRYICSRMIDG